MHILHWQGFKDDIVRIVRSITHLPEDTNEYQRMSKTLIITETARLANEL